jgi:hypothetical protein
MRDIAPASEYSSMADCDGVGAKFLEPSKEQGTCNMIVIHFYSHWRSENSIERSEERADTICDMTSGTGFGVTEIGVPSKRRHTRSVGQSVAGRAPGWSGSSRVNNKQV